MEMLFKLFLMFVKLCCFAFGGGYVMIPGMIKISEENHWATASELTDVVAIAGMSPGPVAVNAAVGYGYKVAGIPGTIAAFLGIAVPCAIIVIVVAAFFFKMYENAIVQAILYGLRPVISGIILYAGVSIAIKNNIITSSHKNLIEKGINLPLFGTRFIELKSIIIILLTFILLKKTKVQPIFLILAAGVTGIFIF